MKWTWILLVAASLAMGVAAPIEAATGNDGAGISIHLGPWVAQGNCDPGPLTVSTMDTDGPVGLAQTAYFLVCNGSDSVGIAGMEFGISFPPEVMVGTPTPCGTLDFPQAGWPASGSGILITWDGQTNCQNQNAEPFVASSVIAVGMSMYCYAYAPGQLSVTPGPVSGRLKVADCSAAETDLTDMFPSRQGIAGFGGAGSYRSCAAIVPVRATTWGRIKSQF